MSEEAHTLAEKVARSWTGSLEPPAHVVERAQSKVLRTVGGFMVLLVALGVPGLMVWRSGTVDLLFFAFCIVSGMVACTAMSVETFVVLVRIILRREK